MRVGIVDYGMGNLLSVFNALEMLGADVKICSHPEDMRGCDRIILPGVGAFPDCIKNLHEKGFVEILDKEVRGKGKPFLGICLGMQALALRGFEGGEHEGLGWIEADVVRLAPSDPFLRVPHIGWNEITYSRKSPLFAGLPESPDFYFVHSFFMNCREKNVVEATCDYGGTVTAAVRKDNIAATQFHPEKSQDYGLRFLDNFLCWNP